MNCLDMFTLDLSTWIWINWNFSLARRELNFKLNLRTTRYILLELEPLVSKVKCIKIIGLPGPMRKWEKRL